MLFCNFNQIDESTATATWPLWVPHFRNCSNACPLGYSANRHLSNNCGLAGRKIWEETHQKNVIDVENPFMEGNSHVFHFSEGWKKRYMVSTHTLNIKLSTCISHSVFLISYQWLGWNLNIQGFGTIHFSFGDPKFGDSHHTYGLQNLNFWG